MSLTLFADVVTAASGDFLPPTLLLRGVTLGIIFLFFFEGREDGVSKGLPPVVVVLACFFRSYPCDDDVVVVAPSYYYSLE